MLLLETTTLFYFNLSTSAPSKDRTAAVRKWAGSVAAGNSHGPSRNLATGSQSTQPTRSELNSTSSHTVLPLSTARESTVFELDATPKPLKRLNSKSLVSANDNNDHHLTATPGGFEDEDEHLEREAAMSSPIKYGQRLTSSVSFLNSRCNEYSTSIQGIVKIKSTNNNHPVKHPKSNGKARLVIPKLTNKDLPRGCQDGNLWRRRFIPTYMTFVASYNQVWSVIDGDAIDAMQKIWDQIYGQKIPHTIELHDAVFQTVFLNDLHRPS
jgi:hypothetical protein